MDEQTKKKVTQFFELKDALESRAKKDAEYIENAYATMERTGWWDDFHESYEDSDIDTGILAQALKEFVCYNLLSLYVSRGQDNPVYQMYLTMLFARVAEALNYEDYDEVRSEVENLSDRYQTGPMQPIKMLCELYETNGGNYEDLLNPFASLKLMHTITRLTESVIGLVAESADEICGIYTPANN